MGWSCNLPSYLPYNNIMSLHSYFSLNITISCTNRFEANSTAMIPSLRNISFSTHLILPQNITNEYAIVGNLKIHEQFEFISHLFHYRSPDLNYEFATFSEVSKCRISGLCNLTIRTTAPTMPLLWRTVLNVYECF